VFTAVFLLKVVIPELVVFPFVPHLSLWERIERGLREE
jgi:hypothetical protein